ncbi:hypothetical protein CAPTEDRAFT_185305, partial [Capitella teleta]
TAGFFLECGGLDGERSSNTLWLEQKRDWNGVLIEMDPSYYMQLRGKNRKCYSINACLSPNGYPDTVRKTFIIVKREKMCNNEVVAEARVLLCHDENLHEVKYMEKGALERVLFFVTRTER